MSTELQDLGAKPTDLKISKVYKITNPTGYEKLNLIFAHKPEKIQEGSLFTFMINKEPMWVKHQGGNTYNVDDHRQYNFPTIGTAITIEDDEDATEVRNWELEAIKNIRADGRTRRRRRRRIGGKGKTRKRKRKRKSTKKKRRRKRKRTKKKRRRRR